MKKVTEMYVLVSPDSQPEGWEEGVMGFNGGNGWMPFVCSSKDTLKKVIELADRVAKESNITYKVLRFTQAEDVTEEVKSGK